MNIFFRSTDATGVFALGRRERATIEIGNVRFLYGADDRVLAHAGPRPGAGSGSIEAGHPLPDLLRDGSARAGATDELPRLLMGAFASRTRVLSLERSLPLVAEHAGASDVAAYLRDRERGLVAVAGWPGRDVTTRLGAIAGRASSENEGRLARGGAAADLTASRDTVCEPAKSAAAVPLVAGDRVLGALAIERFSEASLDRNDLARLAVAAARIGGLLAIKGSGENDTRGLDA